MERTVDVTTVADDLAVIHVDGVAHRFDGLDPRTEYSFDVGSATTVDVTTLDRPAGRLLCRVATVNDLHFGEIECGRIDDHPEGPIQRVGPDDPPYPETMNRAAVGEIAAIDPAAVIVKGDLSADGTDEEWAAFDACYGVFGDRLHTVRGNHDAHRGQARYVGDRWVEVPGLTIGLLDTVIPRQTSGALRPDQVTAIDDRLSTTSGRVVLMGHHQQWIDGTDGERTSDYFGLQPDGSDALDDLCVRHRNVSAYAAGHTHRHRVRSMRASGVPSIEVGCVKDFPGTWAEYRVYEGGVMQVVHRMSVPDALAWSERCRCLYSDFGIDYGTYALGTLADRCFVIADR